MTDASEVPSFDPKVIRRATRRGLLRTAVLVLVALLLLNTAVPYAAKGWQNRGDHDTRFFEIVSTAHLLGRPGYRIESWGCCIPDRRFGLSFDIGLEGLDFGRPDAQVNVTVRQDWRGHVKSIKPLVSPFALQEQLFLQGALTKDESRALLSSYPESASIAAVARFAAPMPPEAVHQEIGDHIGSYILTPIAGDGRFVRPVLAWPGDFKALASWGRELEPHDHANLGLPVPLTLKQIKDLAANPMVYGVIVERRSAGELLALLDQPQVGVINVLDAHLEVDPNRGRGSRSTSSS